MYLPLITKYMTFLANGMKYMTLYDFLYDLPKYMTLYDYMTLWEPCNNTHTKNLFLLVLA